MKRTEYEKIQVNNLDVILCKEDNNINALFWNYNNKEFYIYSDMNVEDLCKIIESINFKEIEEIL